MFCPSCGKSIPDESNFCMYCGASVSKPKSKHSAIVPSEEMPAYIKELSYWENDIKDSRNRRGFGVSFVLLDKALQPTRYDGELEIRVEGRSSMFAKFKKRIQVSKDDFRASRKDPNWYGFVFDHPEPIIDKDPYWNYASIQFLPKGGKNWLKATTSH